ncbi:amidohydrolase family protein [Aureisphaera galaxeae]|uniref:amidohydrolase family protein n=1 Tax=Aureisphaera galaxeae TaxID=1538023 RepID=UPI00235023C4|nr:amidohydrolase family protein [Aureisphaera galaxeae]MDC8006386.1 amidohydrolase family protein [Aureisphaera galaxeae]
MLKIIQYYSLLIILLLSSCMNSQDKANDDTEGSRFQIIKNVRLITMRDSLVQEDMSVVLKGKAIEWIGKTRELPDYTDATVTEGNNNFLIPGLADMHVHIRSQIELYSYLYFGVTTVLQLSGPNAGIDLFELRKSLKSDTVIGPRLYMTGPMLDGDPAIWNEPVSIPIDGPEKAAQVVRSQAESGYDFIKIYNRLSKPSFDAVVTTAEEHGMTVLGHIPRGPGAVYALENGERMIAHMEEFFFSYFDCVKCGKKKLPDESKISELVEVLKEHGTWVTPNLSFVIATRRQLDDFEAVASDPEFKYLTSGRQNSWRKYNPTTRKDPETFDERERVKYPLCQKLTFEFHKAGIPLLTGSDASVSGVYPGKSLHDELEELSKAGLSNYEALKAATYNGGRFVQEFGKNKESQGFGVIEVGKRADLLLLGVNPLETIRFEDHILKVVSKGSIMDREEIGKLRDELKED